MCWTCGRSQLGCIVVIFSFLTGWASLEWTKGVCIICTWVVEVRMTSTVKRQQRATENKQRERGFCFAKRLRQRHGGVYIHTYIDRRKGYYVPNIKKRENGKWASSCSTTRAYMFSITYFGWRLTLVNGSRVCVSSCVYLDYHSTLHLPA